MSPQVLTSLTELSLRVVTVVTTVLLVAQLRIIAAISKQVVLTITIMASQVWGIFNVEVSDAGASSDLALVVIALHLLDIRLGANVIVLKLDNLTTHIVELFQLILEALLLGSELCVLLATTELWVVLEKVARPSA